MKQYNRIIPGKGGMYINECLEGGFIGVDFVGDTDLSNIPATDERLWRDRLKSIYQSKHPEKTIYAVGNAAGQLWMACHGLRVGDVVIVSNGKAGYHVGTLTGGYYYAPGQVLPHRRKVQWTGKIIQRSHMSKELQHSTGSICTLCAISKHADEIERLISGATAGPVVTVNPMPATGYIERDLHRLIANYLIDNGIYAKTIFHETSTNADKQQKWIHPDMVGVRFNTFKRAETRALLRETDPKAYIELHSYELKRSVDTDHQLKEYFFQALSNSSWANYGYLVAFDIEESLLEEMERLNRAFGIGIIHLSPYSSDTRVLFQAKRNELDYYTIDKLSLINKDFATFICRATNVLNAPDNTVDDIASGLRNFCDKGFKNDDEIKAYCEEKHITY